ncbi:Ig-like domain-containing protein [Dyadobacter subterraneus]|uniref:Ig-like domain-containing protein n=1 Tax=Dyadobacter subterraneus TaxID=2773304 RepID=A0ABR9WAD1_9BACT|nr:Ig-like domain-containing protein [Dyadobacter subterraneus]MBE9462435.1 Ig-like domain-containing protein [Dyadobacter subterraneus]
MNKGLLLLLISASWFVSCSKEAEPESKIDSDVVELKYNQSHQFVIKKGNEILPGSSFNWNSSDDNVGTISTDGNFKARKIGSSTITARLKDQTFKSRIIVSEYSSLVREPDFQFGQDKATTKLITNKFLTQESENVLIYNGGPSLNRIIYIFEYDNLVGVIMDFADTEAVEKEVTLFYKERYPIVASTENSNDSIFINDERDKAIRLTRNESLGFYAAYGKITAVNGRLSTYSKSFDKVLKMLNDI